MSERIVSRGQVRPVDGIDGRNYESLNARTAVRPGSEGPQTALRVGLLRRSFERMALADAPDKVVIQPVVAAVDLELEAGGRSVEVGHAGGHEGGGNGIGSRHVGDGVRVRQRPAVA